MSSHKDRNTRIGVCHAGVVTLWMTSFNGAFSRACPSAVQPP